MDNFEVSLIFKAFFFKLLYNNTTIYIKKMLSLVWFINIQWLNHTTFLFLTFISLNVILFPVCKAWNVFPIIFFVTLKISGNFFKILSSFFKDSIFKILKKFTQFVNNRKIKAHFFINLVKFKPSYIVDLFLFFEEYFEECFELNNVFPRILNIFPQFIYWLTNFARILGQDLPYSFFEFISLKIIDDFQVALFRR